MKVTDPFSGYQLARGHVVFHIAFFAGSFFVTDLKNYSLESLAQTDQYSDLIDYESAFLSLRWTHFTVAIFYIFTDVIRELYDTERNTNNKYGRTGLELLG